MLKLSSRWYLRVLGKFSEISDLPCLLLRSQKLYSVYVGDPHLVTSVHMIGPRGLLHMIWVWCLQGVSLSCVCHHGGYLPRRVFLHHVNILGRVSTRFGLGLVCKICEDTNSNGHLWEVERSTTHKKEWKWVIYGLNFHLLLSYHLGLWLITCTKIMVQKIAIGQASGQKSHNMISSFVGQDVVPLKPQSSSACSIRTKKNTVFPRNNGKPFFKLVTWEF